MDKDGIGLFPICVSHELRDLSNIPYRDIPGTDLAIVVGYRGVPDEETRKNLHMSDEDIFAKIEKEKPSFRLELMGMLLGLDEEESTGLHVLTTEDRFFGAAVLGFPEELKKAAQFFGEGFYVFPSSVHEVILLPDSKAEGIDPVEFQQMVSEINKTAVEEEERLSNSIYHFDGEKLTVAAGPVPEEEDSDNGK